MRARLYKYTDAHIVFTSSIVINRAEYARSLVIIKHKYILKCNHKIVINIMLCLLNSTVVESLFQTRLTKGQ